MPTPDASMSYARAVDVLLFGDASAPPLRPVTSPVKARRVAGDGA